MSDCDNPIGLEPIPRESNSRMLTIYIMGYYRRLNRTRTHIPRVVFWSVIQLHHKPNLIVYHLGFEPRLNWA